MEDLEELKRLYPIQDTIAMFIGPPVHKGSAWTWHCPFHEDRTPSFYATPSRCVCKAGCLIAGREWGDVFDFIREYYGLNSLADAIRQLKGESAPTVVIREVPKEPERTIGWWDVKRALQHQAEAIPYFIGRGVSEASIKSHQLGVYTDWPWKTELSDERFYVRRYAIPDIAYGNVRNIELRRDDTDARARLSAIDPRLVTRASDGSEHGLLDFFFGPKYVRVPGGVQKNLVFNAERALQYVTHDGVKGWFSPEMGYLLVHEGFLKALVTEDAAGPEYIYPSVSAKGASGLAYLYGVKRLIIVQDNEPDKTKKDGTKFNPGAEYARRAVEASRRRSGIEIIKPPDGLKGADDAAVAGEAVKWLEKNGIYPERRQK